MTPCPSFLMRLKALAADLADPRLTTLLAEIMSGLNQLPYWDYYIDDDTILAGINSRGDFGPHDYIMVDRSTYHNGWRKALPTETPMGLCLLPKSGHNYDRTHAGSVIWVQVLNTARYGRTWWLKEHPEWRF